MLVQLAWQFWRDTIWLHKHSGCWNSLTSFAHGLLVSSSGQALVRMIFLHLQVSYCMLATFIVSFVMQPFKLTWSIQEQLQCISARIAAHLLVLFWEMLCWPCLWCCSAVESHMYGVLAARPSDTEQTQKPPVNSATTAILTETLHLHQCRHLSPQPALSCHWSVAAGDVSSVA